MKLICNIIYFKSSEPFFSKEESGIKNNTVRTLDTNEGILLNENIALIRYIGITSMETNDTFVRKLRDVSFYVDRWIFTWEDWIWTQTNVKNL